MKYLLVACALLLSFSVAQAQDNLVDWGDAPRDVDPIVVPPDDPGPLTVFSSRNDFDAAVPPRSQSCENYEDTNIADSTVAGFNGPLNSSTNTAMFPAGSIVDNLTIDTPRAELDLVALGPASGWGNPSDLVAANFFVDPLDLFFDSGPHSVALDVVNLTGGSTVVVSVYDTSDALIGTVNVSATETPGFVGVSSPVPIGRVRLYDPASGAEGGDNICFSDELAPFTARFAVVKFFLDQNPADVTVNLECNTGTDRVQSAEISGLLGGDNLVVFVNEEMLPDADGDLFWCEVTETNQPNGYVPLYIPFEVDNATTEDFQAIAEAHHGDYPTSCRYEGAIGPDGPPPPPDVEDLIANVDHIGPIQELNVCLIINVPHPVEVDVSKVWDITGAGDGGDNYSKETTIRVKSDWILDGGKCHQHGGGYGAEEDGYKSDCVFLDFSGDQTKSVWVWPFYNPGDDDVDDGIPVYFREMGMDSAYEVTSTCGNGNEGMIRVRVGDSSAGCTFTNTLFFEGIPTLNQYGLALLALLMLGMGAVAFRRIA